MFCQGCEEAHTRSPTHLTHHAPFRDDPDASARHGQEPIGTAKERHTTPLDRPHSFRDGPTETSLTIRASNPERGAAPVGTGLGLAGMAERVRLIGGSLTHGVDSDGNFVLAATLPVGASA
jgi:hypothetical protein